MIGEFSPGLILIVGALLVPLLRGQLRSAYMLALPIVAFWYLLGLEHGSFGQIEAVGTTLVTLRVDKLSLVFGYIFLIAAFLGLLYALHVDDTLQHVAALIYAGSAVGAVFAGDLLSLFIFWEGTAVASVFLIWASRTEAAYAAGLRYLVFQVGSGVLLLAGAIVHYRQTGSLAFDHIGLSSLASWLIFLSFGVKCAFPLLHNWLPDAYPKATVTGTVILSAFTTKFAVYALVRGFSGTELLVPIGAVMAAFPIVFALIENDLRRVLAYGLNSQLGFMVAGVGIGSELAINGVVAHAVASVAYMALLFMSIGAVLYRAGTANASELGGLYKSMPWTAGFCMVGAAAISSFPLFSGFVSKALTVSAAMDGGYFWTWLVLVGAGAAAFIHTGIRVPYLAFFAQDSGKRPEEAPGNMRWAMAIAAALCLLIGILPGWLYALLPHPVSYAAYTFEHIVTQLQILAFAALAFTVLLRMGLYPAARPSINLDFDWLYRRGGTSLANAIGRGLQSAWDAFVLASRRMTRHAVAGVYRHHGPEGMLARTWPTGDMAFWTTVILAACLILAYV
jgi:multicomponent Na+:H+ antiporter subunit D